MRAWILGQIRADCLVISGGSVARCHGDLSRAHHDLRVQKDKDSQIPEMVWITGGGAEYSSAIG